MSDYWAHTENSTGQPHLLHDHLRSVGELARQFAAQMNPQLCEAAQWAGLLHDLGKYRDEFQQYLRGQRESSEETHHAIYGAALTFKRKCIGPTLAIAGHHAGLHNLHELFNDLKADEKYKAQAQLPLIGDKFEKELGHLAEKIAEPDFIKTNKLSTELYVRMLFRHWWTPIFSTLNSITRLHRAQFKIFGLKSCYVASLRKKSQSPAMGS